MSTHPFRIVASLLLAIGGLVVAVSALAIVLAQVLTSAGMAVRPADAQLLGDLIAVIPFIVGFAAIDLVAAAGLALGKSWADTVAVGVAATAVTVGAVGLTILVLGHDPLASGAAARSTNDGIGIVGAFTVLYLVAIVAVSAVRSPRAISWGATA
jgi:hypothetical protein